MFRSIAITLTLCLATATAQAALLSRAGGQAYYDDVLNITWLADANLAASNTFGVTGICPNSIYLCLGAGTMDWGTAHSWVGAMNTANYLGVNNWRLPETLQPDASCNYQYDPGHPDPVRSYGYGCTGSEMGHLYNVDGISGFAPSPFSNIQPENYWSGTTYAPDVTDAWLFYFYAGNQGYSPKSTLYHAWAVSDGDSLAPVPAPPAVWLFGSALGLMGWMRRKVS